MLVYKFKQLQTNIIYMYWEFPLYLQFGYQLVAFTFMITDYFSRNHKTNCKYSYHALNRVFLEILEYKLLNKWLKIDYT